MVCTVVDSVKDHLVLSSASASLADDLHASKPQYQPATPSMQVLTIALEHLAHQVLASIAWFSAILIHGFGTRCVAQAFPLDLRDAKQVFCPGFVPQQVVVWPEQCLISEHERGDFS